MNYADKLEKAAKKYNSVVCMGLDPVIDAFPKDLQGYGIDAAVDYFREIFYVMEEKGVYPGAFKPNQGFFVKHDRPIDNTFEGSRTLAELLRMIHLKFPDVPVILDFKRGDIATASQNYAVEGYDCWQADALTVSPLMGTDSVAPFIKYTGKGKGVYILNRNSNPGAKDFQNLTVGEGHGGMPLFSFISEKIMEWAEGKSGVGAVVGAVSPSELREIAGFFAGKKIPLLIPGVGAQGGSAEEVTSILKSVNYRLPLVRISSSSGITHPWYKRQQPAPDKWAETVVDNLAKLNREIGFASD